MREIASMNAWRRALAIGWRSACVNALPIAVLWGIAVALVLSYYLVPGVAATLEPIRMWQERNGWRAVVVGRIFFSGLVPGVFLLLVPRIRPKHPWATIVAFVAWGCALGVCCDAFFRVQSVWFGNGPEWGTLVAKTLVDQFLWTVVFLVPLNTVFYYWLGCDFSLRRMISEWPSDFVRELMLPNLVNNWLIGIPVIFATYAFPLDLQIHVNGLVGAVCLLLFTQIGKLSRTGGVQRNSISS